MSGMVVALGIVKVDDASMTGAVVVIDANEDKGIIVSSAE